MKFTVLRNGQPVSADDLEKIALHEPWARHLVYCDMDCFAILEDGTLVLLDECGNYACPPPDEFTVRWEEGRFERKESQK